MRYAYDGVFQEKTAKMICTSLSQKVRFPYGKQREFLDGALSDLHMKKTEFSKIANVCPRTLFDWKREKYNMSLFSLRMICKKLALDQPNDMEILPEHWNLKKACTLGGKRYTN